MVPSCGRRFCSSRRLALYLACLMCIMLPPACDASPWAMYQGIRDITQDELASMATALRDTPIKHYRYLFDTAGGRRRRLGPLPHEVAMPSALRVLKVSEMVAPARPNSAQEETGKGLNLNCLLDEMSVVDETVVFTHAVAATKVLSQQVEALAQRTEEVWAVHQRVVSDITHTLTSKDPTTEGSAGLVRTNVMAQTVLMSTINESIEARRWAGQTKRAILQRRWDIKKSAVSKRVASEVRSIESALEGQRQALALEMTLEKHALGNDTSGADEASLEILAARRKVEEARLQARLDTELATAKMQIQAHEELTRLAHELAMQRSELEASESRRYVHEVAGLLSDGALHLVVSLTSDWARSGTLLLLLIALVVASVTAHDVAVLGKEALKRRFERPRLVRERKRARTGNELVVLGPCDEPSSAPVPPGLARTRALLHRRGVVVPEPLELRLHDVMRGVEVALARGLPLRHVMLHGGPGTGKSMLVEAIAESVGLEVCVIGGSDFGPLGEMGAMEMHKIFDWARRSPKGLMLVIEEADSALGDREGQRLSDWRRSLLSAVLYYTGEASTKHMLVVVSNRPGDIDQAVIDRMDMIIEVPLPGMAERSRLLQKLFKQYMPHVPLPTGGEQAASMLAPLARELEGFSCREVEKLVLAIQRPSLQTSSQQGGEDTTSQLPDVMALAVKLAHETRASKETGGRDRLGQIGQAMIPRAADSVYGAAQNVDLKEAAGAATRESK